MDWDITGGVIEAISMLKEEQRTANLIAYYTKIHTNPYIRDMIEKRLGLS